MNLQKVLINLVQKCLRYQNIIFLVNFIHLKNFLSIRYTENAYIFVFMLYFTSIYAPKNLFNDQNIFC